MLSTHHIFVIIPFFNGDAFIHECVKSVMNASDVNVTVVLVNNSTAQTNVHTLMQDYKDRVVIIDEKPSIGFAKANNIGAAYALKHGATHVLCLNQDTVVDPMMISDLYRLMESNPKIGIAAPLIYDFNTNQIEPFYIRWYYGNMPDMISDAIQQQLKPYYLTEKVSGACMMLRSNFVDQCGLFDESYFMYNEDEDLCRKVIHQGLHIAVHPKCRIFHYHTNTRTDLSNDAQTQKSLWQRKSAQIYILKNTRVSFTRSVFSVWKKNFVDYINMLLSLQLPLLIRSMIVDFGLLFQLSNIKESYEKEKRLSYKQ